MNPDGTNIAIFDELAVKLDQKTPTLPPLPAHDLVPALLPAPTLQQFESPAYAFN